MLITLVQTTWLNPYVHFFLQLASPLSSLLRGKKSWNVISNSFTGKLPCLFYTKVTDVWMPAAVPSTLNGTFTVFRPHRGSSASGGHNKPCKSVKLTENKDVQTRAHVRFYAHVHTHAHVLFIKLLHLHIAGWHPTETPSVQQTDYTCLRLMDLNCHIFTSPGRNKLGVSVCISGCGLCVCFHLFISPRWDILKLVCRFQHSHFREQSTQSSDGLPWREAISCMLNGPSDDANISLISHRSHLHEQHHYLHTERCTKMMLY